MRHSGIVESGRFSQGPHPGPLRGRGGRYGAAAWGADAGAGVTKTFGPHSDVWRALRAGRRLVRKKMSGCEDAGAG